jgi:universal stress protein E
MQPIRHILVIVDPAAALRPCVAKAARLARATGATLELFVCDHAAELFSNRFGRDDVLQLAVARRRAELDTLLRELAEPLRTAGMKVQTDMAFQEPLHLGVVSKALACGADLVVKDTHYHAAAQRALFTNTDWHLIRECPVPLLLTKPSSWSSRIRIAAALDPAHVDDKPAALDRSLLDATEQLAAALQGAAFAVHAFDPLPVLAGMASASTTTRNSGDCWPAGRPSTGTPSCSMARRSRCCRTT